MNRFISRLQFTCHIYSGGSVHQAKPIFVVVAQVIDRSGRGVCGSAVVGRVEGGVARMHHGGRNVFHQFLFGTSLFLPTRYITSNCCLNTVRVCTVVVQLRIEQNFLGGTFRAKKEKYFYLFPYICLNQKNLKKT